LQASTIFWASLDGGSDRLLHEQVDALGGDGQSGLKVEMVRRADADEIELLRREKVQMGGVSLDIFAKLAGKFLCPVDVLVDHSPQDRHAAR
jgi:hypothetical protein